MIWLLFAVRAVHIASTAVWFAIKLSTPRDIKSSLAAGTGQVPTLVARVERTLSMSMGAGVMTVLSGLTMIFLMGGFGAVGPRIHIGLTLALVLLVFEALVQRGTWKKIKAAAEGGQMDGALALARRFSAVSGVSQLLWTVILILMVFRF